MTCAYLCVGDTGLVLALVGVVRGGLLGSYVLGGGGGVFTAISIQSVGPLL